MAFPALVLWPPGGCRQELKETLELGMKIVNSIQDDGAPVPQMFVPYPPRRDEKRRFALWEALGSGFAPS